MIMKGLIELLPNVEVAVVPVIIIMVIIKYNYYNTVLLSLLLPQQE